MELLFFWLFVLFVCGCLFCDILVRLWVYVCVCFGLLYVWLVACLLTYVWDLQVLIVCFIMPFYLCCYVLTCRCDSYWLFCVLCFGVCVCAGSMFWLVGYCFCLWIFGDLGYWFCAAYAWLFELTWWLHCFVLLLLLVFNCEFRVDSLVVWLCSCLAVIC